MTVAGEEVISSPNRAYIPELHQLRGIAALLVFFYHATHSGRTAIGMGGEWPVAGNPLAALLWEGHSGVALFMVLSGFILSYGTFDREIDYRRFIENRARRILPLMTIVLIFGTYAVSNIDFGQIAAAFLLFRNTPAAFQDPSGLSGTVWTVAVEFQFYLVAPFLFALVAREGLRAVAALAIFFFSLKVLILASSYADAENLFRINYFTIVGRAGQFLIGIGLAYIVYRHRPPQQSRWLLALAVALTLISCWLWVLNASGGINKYKIWHVIFPEVEGLLWAGVLVSFWLGQPIRNRHLAQWLEFVGTISFGVYILHYSIQHIFWRAVPGLFAGLVTNMYQVLLLNILLLIPVLSLAWISWTFVEKPFLSRRKRYIASLPATESA